MIKRPAIEFDKDLFKRSVEYNVRTMYRRTMKEATEQQVFHYLAYTAVIAFYWYVWALFREASGDVMGEGLYNWRSTAKKYSRTLLGRRG